MQQRYAVLRASSRGGVNKELLIRTAATLQCGIKPPNIPIAGRGVPVPKAENNGVVSEADDQAHFEDRHLRSCNPLDGRALAPDSTPPSQPRLSKPTTFWPEVVTPNLLKRLLKSAVALAGKPPGSGWTMSADDESSNRDRSRVVVTSFGQKDVSLSFPLMVEGKEVTRTIRACVGMARITETVTPKAPAGGRGRAPRPNAPVVTYRVSQFYPVGDGTDTLSFESMQTIKAALGKRNWKS